MPDLVWTREPPSVAGLYIHLPDSAGPMHSTNILIEVDIGASGRLYVLEYRHTQIIHGDILKGMFLGPLPATPQERERSEQDGGPEDA